MAALLLPSLAETVIVTVRLLGRAAVIVRSLYFFKPSKPKHTRKPAASVMRQGGKGATSDDRAEVRARVVDEDVATHAAAATTPPEQLSVTVATSVRLKHSSFSAWYHPWAFAFYKHVSLGVMRGGARSRTVTVAVHGSESTPFKVATAVTLVMPNG